MSVIVLGISGKAEVGKDYVAASLSGWQRFSLAWHFKVWAVAQGKATYEEVFDTKPPHVRKLLQLAGTEEGRDVYGEDIWCNAAQAWIQILASVSDKNPALFVVPDVRFPNEVDMIHSMGGRVLRIEAPQRAAKSRLTEEQRLHPSEVALDNYDKFDGILHNDENPIIDMDLQLMQHFRNFGWIQRDITDAKGASAQKAAQAV